MIDYITHDILPPVVCFSFKLCIISAYCSEKIIVYTFVLLFCGWVLRMVIFAHMFSNSEYLCLTTDIVVLSIS